MQLISKPRDSFPKEADSLDRRNCFHSSIGITNIGILMLTRPRNIVWLKAPWVSQCFNQNIIPVKWQPYNKNVFPRPVEKCTRQAVTFDGVVWFLRFNNLHWMLKREQTVLAYSKDLTATFHSVKLSCYIYIFEAMRNVPFPHPFNLRKGVGAGSYSIFWKPENLFSYLNVDLGLHPQNSLALSVLNFQLRCSPVALTALN